MLAYASELLKSKDLLLTWTGRNIRVRYQQSILGGLWIIVQPLATVVMFSIIFTYFVPVDTGNIPYPVFSYVGVVPWMLLSNSLNDMTNSLVGNMNLITKIYFPREFVPIAAMLARLVDFLVALGLLIILMLVFRVPIIHIGWLYFPLILASQLSLITGLGLIFSAANVFYRDVNSFLVIGIQLWFYASPIIYPISQVPESLRPYYYLNPMAGIIEAYREVFFYQTAPGPYLYLSAIIGLTLLIIGFWLFKRVEFRLADVI